MQCSGALLITTASLLALQEVCLLKTSLTVNALALNLCELGVITYCDVMIDIRFGILHLI